MKNGRKLIGEKKRLPTSVAFDQGILDRIDQARGLMSRSTFINITFDETLDKPGAV